MTRPRLALVSTGIRRDLIAPLDNFVQFDLLHFYRQADYGDLTPTDLAPGLRRYDSPLDLYRKIVNSSPAVIQGVEPFSVYLQPYLWACYFAARASKACLIAVSLENRPLETKFGRITSILMTWGLSIYFNKARLVIALNEGARRNEKACGVAESRIRNLMWGTWGVDLNEFSPRPKKEDRSPTILYAGRLHQEKGILVLLHAFKLVLGTLPQVRLVIAGDGPARQDVEHRTSKMERVTSLGIVKNREMPDLIRSSDVVVVPSLTTKKWSEQVGMTAVQAMACGVPVVASSSGAIPEFVPDKVAGLLVSENNPRELAEALVRVLTDAHLREEMGKAGRAYSIEHYDAVKNIAAAEQVVMEQCCASRV